MGVWIRRLIIIACMVVLIPKIFSLFSGLTNELPEDIKGIQYILYKFNEHKLNDLITIGDRKNEGRLCLLALKSQGQMK
ncbi:hypothetical protein [Gracilibacillus suaedae]|uniref:hypothetical protein n=1 Tax=Gracilibacillus suaedae TaxID=2820273 RepID=UPI001ABE082A|nr:hypothetical protein [Gracilibacillus suaedae]